MKRKKKVATAASVGGEIVAKPVSPTVIGALEEESWFQRLSDSDKTQLTAEDKTLALAMQYAGRSRLAAAASLTRIYDILGPLKVFERYIKRYHLKRRSAYRAIKAYRNALKLPAPILQVAMAKNVNIMGEEDKAPFGVYTEAIRRLPPPKGADEAKASEYLDMLEVKRREIKPKKTISVQEVLGSHDPGDLMRECYRFVNIRYLRLPHDTTKSVKIAWLKTLSGMLLNLGGIEEETVTINLVAPPTDYKAVRGRPRVH